MVRCLDFRCGYSPSAPTLQRHSYASKFSLCFDPSLPSAQPLNPIELRGRRRLRPRLLSPRRHPHRVSPPPVRAHIPQSPYILPHFPPELVFYFQPGELGVDVEHGLGVEGAQPRGGVDVQAGEQVPGHLGSNAVEVLERFLEVLVRGVGEEGGGEGMGCVRGPSVVRGS